MTHNDKSLHRDACQDIVDEEAVTLVVVHVCVAKFMQEATCTGANISIDTGGVRVEYRWMGSRLHVTISVRHVQNGAEILKWGTKQKRGSQLPTEERNAEEGSN